MKVVNVKGMKCPMPLIETKKALKEMKEGETLRILIDNETSVKNVTHFLNDNNLPVVQSKNGEVFELIINKAGDDSFESANELAYCETPGSKDKSYVVVFAKDRIGEGSEELGQALVGAMLHSIDAMEKRPEKIIFMNSGIHLVTKRSLVLPHLKRLEAKEVELISCGTCLDYFEKMEELEVGRVTNMHEIMESMLAVGKVINL